MPFRRKKRASVAPTVRNGIRPAWSVSLPVTRSSASHSGVSIGDAVDGSSLVGLDLDRLGQVAERLVEHRADVLAGLAGQRADVDLELDPVGDDVGLRAAVHDRGRERGVGARVRLARQPDRQVLARAS